MECRTILRFATGGKVRAAGLTPGARVAAILTDPEGGRPGALTLWDPRRGVRLAPPVPLKSLYDLALSPDGAHVATMTREGESLLVATDSGRVVQTLRHERVEPESSVELALAFSPDGASLATFAPDTTVQVWDLAAGRRRYPPLPGLGRGFQVGFSPDGRLLALASIRDTLLIWDARTGEPALPPRPHPDYVHAFAFSPDSRRIASACRDGQVRFWDLRTGALLGAPLGHETELHTLAFTPDGQVLATADRDGRFRLWDTRRGRPLGPSIPLAGFTQTLAISPDGRLAVLGVPHGHHGLTVLDLEALRDPGPLDTEALVAQGELAAGARVIQSRLAYLSADEWLACFERFAAANPGPRLHRLEAVGRPLDPAEQAATLERHAGALARLGRWREALRLAPESPADLSPFLDLLGPLAERGELDDLATALVDLEASGASADELRNNLVWRLLAEEDLGPEALDAVVALAHRAVAGAVDPRLEGTYRNTLGVALYRAGRLVEAAEALRASLDQLSDDSFGYNALALALTLARLGDPTGARDWSARADAWLAAHPQDDAVLRWLQAEAARLDLDGH